VTFAERIRQAPSPSAALLILTEELQHVCARLDALETKPAADGWGHWDTVTPVRAALSADEFHAKMIATPAVHDGRRQQKAIAAIEAALLTATGDDIPALEAKLRLLREDGQAIDINTEAGAVAETVEDGDTVVTVLPTPSQERQLKRMQWANERELWTFSNLPEAEFLNAFSLGGPLWMYHTARDEVMAMPYGWRQEFVADIEQDSPRTAQEVGRDILKSEEADGTRSATLGALDVADE
jgi:hypothetical protein